MKGYIKGGIIASLIALFIGVVGDLIFKWGLQNILFGEGILLVIVGILSSVSGNSKGLSLQGLGNQNAQYASNANLEIKKLEENQVNKKEEINFGIGGIAIIIAGIVCIVVNYII